MFSWLHLCILFILVTCFVAIKISPKPFHENAASHYHQVFCHDERQLSTANIVSIWNVYLFYFVCYFCFLKSHLWMGASSWNTFEEVNFLRAEKKPKTKLNNIEISFLLSSCIQIHLITNYAHYHHIKNI